MPRTIGIPSPLGSAASGSQPVVFEQLVGPDDGITILAARVAAGSLIGGWHRHDRGQYLESVSGEGFVQDFGEQPIALPSGARVWCPPGTVHRHGAAANGEWHQFSITPGGTEWFATDGEAAAALAAAE